MLKHGLVLFIFLLFSSVIFSQTDDCFEKCSRASGLARTQQVQYFQYPSMEKYDVKYLHLDLAIEANNRNISGTALTRAKTIQPLDSFICELRSFMIIDSIFVNGVKNTSFTRGGEHVFIPITPALPTGSTIEVLFYYRGSAGAGGGFPASQLDGHGCGLGI